MDFGILILLIFILLPLLEKLLKSGKQPQQPQQPGVPPGRQRRPLPRERPEGMAGPRSRPPDAADEDVSAATVLPDDLWEILTGERRMPREEPRQEPLEEMAAPPRPADQPWGREEPAARRPVEQEPQRAAGASTGPPVRARRLPPVELRRTRPAPPETLRRRAPSAGPPASEADALVRGVPVREAPTVVSREGPIEDPELRRARFQQRLAAMSEPERGGGPVGAHEYAFRSTDELRRAVIAAEILGRPRGLE